MLANSDRIRIEAMCRPLMNTVDDELRHVCLYVHQYKPSYTWSFVTLCTSGEAIQADRLPV